jgi:hypothetical protein
MWASLRDWRYLCDLGLCSTESKNGPYSKKVWIHAKSCVRQRNWWMIPKSLTSCWDQVRSDRKSEIEEPLWNNRCHEIFNAIEIYLLLSINLLMNRLDSQTKPLFSAEKCKCSPFCLCFVALFAELFFENRWPVRSRYISFTPIGDSRFLYSFSWDTMFVLFLSLSWIALTDEPVVSGTDLSISHCLGEELEHGMAE